MGICQLNCPDLDKNHQIIITDTEVSLKSTNRYMLLTDRKTEEKLTKKPTVNEIRPTSSSVFDKTSNELFPEVGNITKIEPSKDFLTQVKLIQKIFRRHLHHKVSSPFYQIEDNSFKYYNSFIQVNPSLIYRGLWKNRQRDGFGIYKWSGGDVYFGEIKSNLKNGVGKYTSSSTEKTYEGYFCNDLLNGFGIEKWKDGSKFIGEYVWNNKYGIGVLIFEDESYYSGEFKDNDMHGYGSFVKQNGTVLRGVFMNNKLNGFGIWENKKEGQVYEGEFVDNKQEGFGVFYTKGKIKIGIWKNSKLEGEGIIVDQSGIKKYIFKKSVISKELPASYRTIFDSLGEKLQDSL